MMFNGTPVLLDSEERLLSRDEMVEWQLCRGNVLRARRGRLFPIGSDVKLRLCVVDFGMALEPLPAKAATAAGGSASAADLDFGSIGIFDAQHGAQLGLSSGRSLNRHVYFEGVLGTVSHGQGGEEGDEGAAEGDSYHQVIDHYDFPLVLPLHRYICGYYEVMPAAPNKLKGAPSMAPAALVKDPAAGAAAASHKADLPLYLERRSVHGEQLIWHWQMVEVPVAVEARQIGDAEISFNFIMDNERAVPARASTNSGDGSSTSEPLMADPNEDSPALRHRRAPYTEEAVFRGLWPLVANGLLGFRVTVLAPAPTSNELRITTTADVLESKRAKEHAAHQRTLQPRSGEASDATSPAVSSPTTALSPDPSPASSPAAAGASSEVAAAPGPAPAPPFPPPGLLVHIDRFLPLANMRMDDDRGAADGAHDEGDDLDMMRLLNTEEAVAPLPTGGEPAHSNSANAGSGHGAPARFSWTLRCLQSCVGYVLRAYPVFDADAVRASPLPRFFGGYVTTAAAALPAYTLMLDATGLVPAFRTRPQVLKELPEEVLPRSGIIRRHLLLAKKCALVPGPPSLPLRVVTVPNIMVSVPEIGDTYVRVNVLRPLWLGPRKDRNALFPLSATMTREQRKLSRLLRAEAKKVAIATAMVNNDVASAKERAAAEFAATQASDREERERVLQKRLHTDGSIEMYEIAVWEDPRSFLIESAIRLSCERHVRRRPLFRCRVSGAHVPMGRRVTHLIGPLAPDEDYFITVRCRSPKATLWDANVVRLRFRTAQRWELVGDLRLSPRSMFMSWQRKHSFTSAAQGDSSGPTEGRQEGTRAQAPARPLRAALHQISQRLGLATDSIPLYGGAAIGARTPCRLHVDFPEAVDLFASGRVRRPYLGNRAARLEGAAVWKDVPLPAEFCEGGASAQSAVAFDASLTYELRITDVDTHTSSILKLTSLEDLCENLIAAASISADSMPLLQEHYPGTTGSEEADWHSALQREDSSGGHLRVLKKKRLARQLLMLLLELPHLVEHADVAVAAPAVECSLAALLAPDAPPAAPMRLLGTDAVAGRTVASIMTRLTDDLVEALCDGEDIAETLAQLQRGIATAGYRGDEDDGGRAELPPLEGSWAIEAALLARALTDELDIRKRKLSALQQAAAASGIRSGIAAAHKREQDKAKLLSVEDATSLIRKYFSSEAGSSLCRDVETRDNKSSKCWLLNGLIPGHMYRVEVRATLVDADTENRRLKASRRRVQLRAAQANEEKEEEDEDAVNANRHGHEGAPADVEAVDDGGDAHDSDNEDDLFYPSAPWSRPLLVQLPSPVQTRIIHRSADEASVAWGMLQPPTPLQLPPLPWGWGGAECPPTSDFRFKKYLPDLRTGDQDAPYYYYMEPLPFIPPQMLKVAALEAGVFSMSALRSTFSQGGDGTGDSFALIKRASHSMAPTGSSMSEDSDGGAHASRRPSVTISEVNSVLPASRRTSGVQQQRQNLSRLLNTDTGPMGNAASPPPLDDEALLQGADLTDLLALSSSDDERSVAGDSEASDDWLPSDEDTSQGKEASSASPKGDEADVEGEDATAALPPSMQLMYLETQIRTGCETLTQMRTALIKDHTGQGRSRIVNRYRQATRQNAALQVRTFACPSEMHRDALLAEMTRLQDLFCHYLLNRASRSVLTAIGPVAGSAQASGDHGHGAYASASGHGIYCYFRSDTQLSVDMFVLGHTRNDPSQAASAASPAVTDPFLQSLPLLTQLNPYGEDMREKVLDHYGGSDSGHSGTLIFHSRAVGQRFGGVTVPMPPAPDGAVRADYSLLVLVSTSRESHDTVGNIADAITDAKLAELFGDDDFEAADNGDTPSESHAARRRRRVKLIRDLGGEQAAALESAALWRQLPMASRQRQRIARKRLTRRLPLDILEAFGLTTQWYEPMSVYQLCTVAPLQPLIIPGLQQRHHTLLAATTTPQAGRDGLGTSGVDSEKEVEGRSSPATGIRRRAESDSLSPNKTLALSVSAPHRDDVPDNRVLQLHVDGGHMSVDAAYAAKPSLWADVMLRAAEEELRMYRTVFDAVMANSAGSVGGVAISDLLSATSAEKKGELPADRCLPHVFIAGRSVSEVFMVLDLDSTQSYHEAYLQDWSQTTLKKWNAFLLAHKTNKNRSKSRDESGAPDRGSSALQEIPRRTLPSNPRLYLLSLIARGLKFGADAAPPQTAAMVALAEPAPRAIGPQQLADSCVVHAHLFVEIKMRLERFVGSALYTHLMRITPLGMGSGPDNQGLTSPSRVRKGRAASLAPSKFSGRDDQSAAGDDTASRASSGSRRSGAGLKRRRGAGGLAFSRVHAAPTELLIEVQPVTLDEESGARVASGEASYAYFCTTSSNLVVGGLISATHYTIRLLAADTAVRGMEGTVLTSTDVALGKQLNRDVVSEAMQSAAGGASSQSPTGGKGRVRSVALLAESDQERAPGPSTGAVPKRAQGSIAVVMSSVRGSIVKPEVKRVPTEPELRRESVRRASDAAGLILPEANSLVESLLQTGPRARSNTTSYSQATFSAAIQQESERRAALRLEEARKTRDRLLFLEDMKARAIAAALVTSCSMSASVHRWAEARDRREEMLGAPAGHSAPVMRDRAEMTGPQAERFAAAIARIEKDRSDAVRQLLNIQFEKGDHLRFLGWTSATTAPYFPSIHVLTTPRYLLEVGEISAEFVRLMWSRSDSSSVSGFDFSYRCLESTAANGVDPEDDERSLVSLHLPASQFSFRITVLADLLRNSAYDFVVFPRYRTSGAGATSILGRGLGHALTSSRSLAMLPEAGGSAREGKRGGSVVFMKDKEESKAPAARRSITASSGVFGPAPTGGSISGHVKGLASNPIRIVSCTLTSTASESGVSHVLISWEPVDITRLVPPCLMKKAIDAEFRSHVRRRQRAAPGTSLRLTVGSPWDGHTPQRRRSVDHDDVGSDCDDPLAEQPAPKPSDAVSSAGSPSTSLPSPLAALADASINASALVPLAPLSSLQAPSLLASEPMQESDTFAQCMEKISRQRVAQMYFRHGYYIIRIRTADGTWERTETSANAAACAHRFEKLCPAQAYVINVAFCFAVPRCECCHMFDGEVQDWSAPALEPAAHAAWRADQPEESGAATEATTEVVASTIEQLIPHATTTLFRTQAYTLRAPRADVRRVGEDCIGLQWTLDVRDLVASTGAHTAADEAQASQDSRVALALQLRCANLTLGTTTVLEVACGLSTSALAKEAAARGPALPSAEGEGAAEGFNPLEGVYCGTSTLTGLDPGQEYTIDIRQRYRLGSWGSWEPLVLRVSTLGEHTLKLRHVGDTFLSIETSRNRVVTEIVLAPERGDTLKVAAGQRQVTVQHRQARAEIFSPSRFLFALRMIGKVASTTAALVPVDATSKDDVITTEVAAVRPQSSSLVSVSQRADSEQRAGSSGSVRKARPNRGTETLVFERRTIRQAMELSAPAADDNDSTVAEDVVLFETDRPEAVLPHLLPATPYRVAVAQWSAAGWGQWSTPLHIYTLPSFVPVVRVRASTYLELAVARDTRPVERVCGECAPLNERQRIAMSDVTAIAVLSTPLLDNGETAPTEVTFVHGSEVDFPQRTAVVRNLQPSRPYLLEVVACTSSFSGAPVPSQKTPIGLSPKDTAAIHRTAQLQPRLMVTGPAHPLRMARVPAALCLELLLELLTGDARGGRTVDDVLGLSLEWSGLQQRQAAPAPTEEDAGIMSIVGASRVESGLSGVFVGERALLEVPAVHWFSNVDFDSAAGRDVEFGGGPTGLVHTVDAAPAVLGRARMLCITTTPLRPQRYFDDAWYPVTPCSVFAHPSDSAAAAPHVVSANVAELAFTINGDPRADATTSDRPSSSPREASADAGQRTPRANRFVESTMGSHGDDVFPNMDPATRAIAQTDSFRRACAIPHIHRHCASQRVAAATISLPQVVVTSVSYDVVTLSLVAPEIVSSFFAAFTALPPSVRLGEGVEAVSTAWGLRLESDTETGGGYEDRPAFRHAEDVARGYAEQEVSLTSDLLPTEDGGAGAQRGLSAAPPPHANLHGAADSIIHLQSMLATSELPRCAFANLCAAHVYRLSIRSLRDNYHQTGTFAPCGLVYTPTMPAIGLEKIAENFAEVCWAPDGLLGGVSAGLPSYNLHTLRTALRLSERIEGLSLGFAAATTRDQKRNSQSISGHEGADGSVNFPSPTDRGASMTAFPAVTSAKKGRRAARDKQQLVRRALRAGVVLAGGCLEIDMLPDDVLGDAAGDSTDVPAGFEPAATATHVEILVLDELAQQALLPLPGDAQGLSKLLAMRQLLCPELRGGRSARVTTFRTAAGGGASGEVSNESFSISSASLSAAALSLSTGGHSLLADPHYEPLSGIQLILQPLRAYKALLLNLRSDTQYVALVRAVSILDPDEETVVFEASRAAYAARLREMTQGTESTTANTAAATAAQAAPSKAAPAPSGSSWFMTVSAGGQGHDLSRYMLARSELEARHGLTHASWIPPLPVVTLPLLELRVDHVSLDFVCVSWEDRRGGADASRGDQQPRVARDFLEMFSRRKPAAVPNSDDPPPEHVSAPGLILGSLTDMASHGTLRGCPSDGRSSHTDLVASTSSDPQSTVARSTRNAATAAVAVQFQIQVRAVVVTNTSGNQGKVPPQQAAKPGAYYFKTPRNPSEQELADRARYGAKFALGEVIQEAFVTNQSSSSRRSIAGKLRAPTGNGTQHMIGGLAPDTPYALTMRVCYTTVSGRWVKPVPFSTDFVPIVKVLNITQGSAAFEFGVLPTSPALATTRVDGGYRHHEFCFAVSPAPRRDRLYEVALVEDSPPSATATSQADRGTSAARTPSRQHARKTHSRQSPSRQRAEAVSIRVPDPDEMRPTDPSHAPHAARRCRHKERRAGPGSAQPQAHQKHASADDGFEHAMPSQLVIREGPKGRCEVRLWALRRDRQYKLLVREVIGGVYIGKFQYLTSFWTQPYPPVVTELTECKGGVCELRWGVMNTARVGEVLTGSCAPKGFVYSVEVGVRDDSQFPVRGHEWAQVAVTDEPVLRYRYADFAAHRQRQADMVPTGTTPAKARAMIAQRTQESLARELQRICFRVRLSKMFVDMEGVAFRVPVWGDYSQVAAWDAPPPPDLPEGVRVDHVSDNFFAAWWRPPLNSYQQPRLRYHIFLSRTSPDGSHVSVTPQLVRRQPATRRPIMGEGGVLERGANESDDEEFCVERASAFACAATGLDAPTSPAMPASAHRPRWIWVASVDEPPVDVTACSAPSRGWRSAVGDGSGRCVIIPSLAKSTTYQLKIQCESVFGFGGKSTVISFGTRPVANTHIPSSVAAVGNGHAPSDDVGPVPEPPHEAGRVVIITDISQKRRVAAIEMGRTIGTSPAGMAALLQPTGLPPVDAVSASMTNLYDKYDAPRQKRLQTLAALAGAHYESGANARKKFQQTLREKFSRAAQKAIIITRVLHSDACRMLLTRTFDANNPDTTASERARELRGQDPHGNDLYWSPIHFAGFKIQRSFLSPEMQALSAWATNTMFEKLSHRHDELADSMSTHGELTPKAMDASLRGFWGPPAGAIRASPSSVMNSARVPSQSLLPAIPSVDATHRLGSSQGPQRAAPAAAPAVATEVALPRIPSATSLPQLVGLPPQRRGTQAPSPTTSATRPTPQMAATPPPKLRPIDKKPAPLTATTPEPTRLHPKPQPTHQRPPPKKEELRTTGPKTNATVKKAAASPAAKDPTAKVTATAPTGRQTPRAATDVLPALGTLERPRGSDGAPPGLPISLREMLHQM